MVETSLSLLKRLRDSPREDDWNRLLSLYEPLVRRWLAAFHLQDADAEDVAQEVFQVVVREMPSFQRGPHTGGFRRWLRMILVNRVREHWRSRKRQPAGGDSDLLDQLESPDSELSRRWDDEHDQLVVRRLLELCERHFTRATVAAFRQVVLERRSAAEAARSLDLSVNAVLIAKSRVLAFLRQEGGGLIDFS